MRQPELHGNTPPATPRAGRRRMARRRGAARPRGPRWGTGQDPGPAPSDDACLV